MSPSRPGVRAALPEDAERIAAIYNLGVAERVATFRSEPREAAYFRGLIEAGALVLVAGDDTAVAGAAWVSDYDPLNAYYSGVGEATVYVDPGARGRGLGRELLDGLTTQAPAASRHKLVAKIFASNAPSLALFQAAGYREVGVHRRHARLDREWRDVVVVERSLG